ncbi:MAG: S-methyl-5-thioribose-1-phosphate isomerase [Ignavibacteria bacterium]
MRIGNNRYRTIWDDSKEYASVLAIDQNALPFSLNIIRMKTARDVYTAIRKMSVRGAPLLGIASAYGIYLACVEARNKSMSPEGTVEFLTKQFEFLLSARPTSVNPEWAMRVVLDSISRYKNIDTKTGAALRTVRRLADNDVKNCRRIGIHGKKLITDIYRKKRGERVNILTHCNAGWLACIDYGTATAPVYLSAESKLPVHVWVEETRPRNQGAKLTAYELKQMEIPHTIITDNAGGYVMQKGDVDIVLVGADRIALNGDACNKVGTYKTALAAHDSGIPFYVCAPLSTIDLSKKNGFDGIIIEERDEDEVRYARRGRSKIELCSPGSGIKNYGFDITPSRLITGIITEAGIIKPNKESILKIKK